ncbi:MAG: transglycosylase SLT domain-containing protein [Candidatus Cloacimonetes bacterium]|nr:transglycosylase SLT domain-containing protein [Candidatus Cloacimonadota bacterium]
MIQLPTTGDIALERRQDEMRKLTDQVRGLDQSRAYDAERAQDVSHQFEAMLIRQMLSAMTDTLEGDGFLGDMPGGDFYNEMFLGEISMTMARRGDLGLSKQIMEQLEQHTEDNDELPVRGLSRADISQIIQVVRRPVPAPSEPQPVGKTLAARLQQFEPLILEAAHQHGLDPRLIKAVIAQESYGNPQVESHAGAKGLMQLMDGTAAGLGVTDSFDPRQNIQGGARYLRLMLDRYDGDIELALAAYNAGPGNVDRYGGIPPFEETQHYVRRVQDYYEGFQ